MSNDNTILREILTELKDVRQDFGSLKQGQDELRKVTDGLVTDFNEMKTDISGLKADVSELTTDVSGLKIDVSELKTNVEELNRKTDAIELAGLMKFKTKTNQRLDNLEIDVKLLKKIVTR